MNNYLSNIYENSFINNKIIPLQKFFKLEIFKKYYLIRKILRK